MSDVEVSCTAVGTGWTCVARVSPQGTRHEVSVSAAELERWDTGSGVEDLVRRSLEFLLEREPAASILRRFQLSDIQRYFPEFDSIMASQKH